MRRLDAIEEEVGESVKEAAREARTKLMGLGSSFKLEVADIAEEQLLVLLLKDAKKQVEANAWLVLFLTPSKTTHSWNLN